MELSSFYDIAYSPNSYKECITAFSGNGRIPKNALDELALQSGLYSKKAIVVLVEEQSETTRFLRHEGQRL